MAEDLVDTALSLASSASDYVIGHVLFMDRGLDGRLILG